MHAAGTPRPSTPEFPLIPLPPHPSATRGASVTATIAAASDPLSLCAAMLDTPFSMAFQPIVDVPAGHTIAFEALVRGPHNEPASTILRSLREADSSDQPLRHLACNLQAIQTAARLGLGTREADLFLNIHPAAEADPASSVRAVLDTALAAGIAARRIVLEITETEPMPNPIALADLLAPFRAEGLRIAIDDFGTGYSGLSTLASFPADLVKFDIALTRNVVSSPAHRVILRSSTAMCHELGIRVIAEGVETAEQQRILSDLGVRLMQGNLFAEPAFQALPAWPDTHTA